MLVPSASSCEEQTFSHVFLPWLDPSLYTLAPDGAFEERASSWSLTGGAAVVHGDASPRLYGARDHGSLRLTPGSSATSASMCVGVGHPTMRFFARRSGGGPLGALSTLRVEVLYENHLGALERLPIGLVLNTGSWQPTLPFPVVANLLPLLPGERTAVAFRFVPRGDATWQVDDVYVDPWRGT